MNRIYFSLNVLKYAIELILLELLKEDGPYLEILLLLLFFLKYPCLESCFFLKVYLITLTWLIHDK